MTDPRGKPALVVGPAQPGAALAVDGALRLTRRDGLRWAVGLGALSAFAAKGHAPWHWQETALLALGTTLWLRVAHDQPQVAKTALAAAVAAVQRVDAALNLFRPDSAISQLNRVGQLHAPPSELVQALRMALGVAQLTNGAFDPTVQPLWRTWFEAHLQGRQPSAHDLRLRRKQLNWRGVQVSDNLVRLAQPGMAITLNGIAQGFAADRAAAALRAQGVTNALLDTGEWLPMGHSGEATTAQPQPWRLALQDTRPRRAQGQAAPVVALPVLLADGRAVACSSDDKLPFNAERTEHHILNPSTGHSPTGLATVLVAAPLGAWADALTKPLFMAGPQEALALAARLGVDVLVIDKTGRWQASPGWRFA